MIASIINFVVFAACSLWISGLMTTIYNRIPNNIPIGPSHKPRCNNCGNILTIRHFLPVFSFIYYRGKCAFCGFKIPKTYILIESIATSLMILYYILNPVITTELVLHVFFIAYLVTLFFIYLDFGNFKDTLAWVFLCFSIMNQTLFEGKINLINLSFIICAVYSGLMLLEKKKVFTIPEKTVIILAFLNMNNILACSIFAGLCLLVHYTPRLSPFMLQKYRMKRKIILMCIAFNILDAILPKLF